MHRIIYYYQTLVTLSSIIFSNPIVTHVHLSSIHFGNNNDGSPYIHLNDYPPNNKIYDPVWDEIDKLNSIGVKNILMVGGAGGAYSTLFSDFDVYYSLLYDTIKKYPIDGIDLDIEELVKLSNVKKLIRRIDQDFGRNFIISMAPVSFALQNDGPGLGNFSYKELYNSKEGKRIDYFNGQFYGDYTKKAYDNVIKNNYPADKIVMGMLGGYQNNTNLANVIDTISNLSDKYPDFGGVFVWEYFDAPPNYQPGLWSEYMYQAIYKDICYSNSISGNKLSSPTFSNETFFN